MINEPIMSMCICGQMIASDFKHVCRNDSMAKLLCDFCGQPIWILYLNPWIVFPRTNSLRGKAICEDCENEAYNFLINKLRIND